MKIQELSKGLFKENPILVLMLGLCPTLAVSTKAIYGIGMGAAVIFVLTCSNVIISLIKDFIPDKIRIPSYIVVIATFVTIVDYVMKAYTPELHKSLGIFIPLIVVNCIILGRAEAFAAKKNVLDSFFDGIGMGLGFTLALTLIAVIREILGAGTITLKLLGYGWIVEIPHLNPMIVMILPPGAFITIGLILGFSNILKKR
ncbi:MAG: electron transport complex subunit E [Spirochaetes bacterium]|nr:electron transport complex subunit E [Spirochaetota bacterium]